VIILQFDSAYHHWGLLMLQSLQLHEPGTSVLCDTVNLTPGEMGQLQRAHARVTAINCASANPTTPELMAARKPFVIEQAMGRYPDEPWYALLDADFLVRRPLASLWSLVDGLPAALFTTDGYEHGIYYRQLVNPSGIVLVRPDARRLIECWAKWTRHPEPLGSIEPLAWFWDQVTLTEAACEAGIPSESIPLHIYADDQLRPDSSIWSANVGDRKPEYYERFRAEYGRQLAEAAPHWQARAISA
jgi:hypothetical protein